MRIVVVMRGLVQEKTGNFAGAFLQWVSETGSSAPGDATGSVWRYGRLADQGDGDAAAMGGGAMFPDVDPLPGSEVAATVGDGDGERVLGEDRAADSCCFSARSGAD
jgi:hypothetical protein